MHILTTTVYNTDNILIFFTLTVMFSYASTTNDWRSVGKQTKHYVGLLFKRTFFPLGRVSWTTPSHILCSSQHCGFGVKEFGYSTDPPAV